MPRVRLRNANNCTHGLLSQACKTLMLPHARTCFSAASPKNTTTKIWYALHGSTPLALPATGRSALNKVGFMPMRLLRASRVTAIACASYPSPWAIVLRTPPNLPFHIVTPPIKTKTCPEDALFSGLPARGVSLRKSSFAHANLEVWFKLYIAGLK